MDQRIEDIRKSLTSEDVIGAFDALVEGRALGASSNIKSIIAFTYDILNNDYDLATAKNALSCMFDYFDDLRGDSSIAVRNAINNLKDGLELYNDIDLLKQGCIEKAKKVEQKIKNDNEMIISSAIPVLKDAKKLFLFDYSSTVDLIASSLFEINPEMEIEVAESRILNGGMPFVKSAIKRGQKVNFITDASLAGSIKECDAVLIGAETLYKEGSVINTPGSELAAFCAKRFGIKFYVASSYLKYDKRGEQMFEKKDVIDSFQHVLSSIIDSCKVSYKAHGFSLVPADCITGYFTEKGYVSNEEFSKIEGEWKI